MDSHSSWVDILGIFDRLEKFSFFAKLGRLKVRGDDFSIVISIGKTHGKSWFLESILTLKRPNFAKNENFYNREKIP